MQGHVQVQQLDLADLSSVQALGKTLDLEKQIDLLILNAGVMACAEDVTKDNFELQVGTNHFGHVQLTRLLLDKLKQQASLRIIHCTKHDMHASIQVNDMTVA